MNDYFDAGLPKISDSYIGPELIIPNEEVKKLLEEGKLRCSNCDNPIRVNEWFSCELDGITQTVTCEHCFQLQPLFN